MFLFCLKFLIANYLSVSLSKATAPCSLETVLPDVKIKSHPYFSKVALKVSKAVLLEIHSFSGSKVTKYFGYFCEKIWHQELTKITQSGHTDWRWQMKFVALWKFPVSGCGKWCWCCNSSCCRPRCWCCSCWRSHGGMNEAWVAITFGSICPA